LYDDRVYKFGEQQAIKYLEALNNLMFVFLSENPEVEKKER